MKYSKSTSPSLSAHPFKLALIQMRVEGGRKRQNLEHSLDLLAEAAEQEADLAVLPEAMPLGWTHPSAATDADEIPEGESCSVLTKTARERKMFICSGLVERAGDKVYNSAVLIDPQGDLLLVHRKINELEIGHHIYALGDRLGVAPTPWGRIGLLICADAFAYGQVISRTLGYLGAGILLSPCSWAVPATHDNDTEPYGQLWLDNYGPVARDFRMWIAGVSNVGWLTEGPWKGRQCIGCSLLMEPAGQPAVRGPYGVEAETILYHEVRLRPRPAHGDGWASYWRQTVQP